jgi:hypothetical protein
MRFEMQLDMQKKEKKRMRSALIKEHEMDPKENKI